MLKREFVSFAVVDLQEKLLPKIAGVQKILENSIKLIQFARHLELPILLTEQYPKGLGPTTAVIVNELEGVAPLEKTAFGCLEAENFSQALRDTGRNQLLIFGIEAHVCVMQTALKAVEEGYEVFVVRDAIGSRRVAEYEAGLERMREAGVVLVTVEMAMFEILRQAGTPEFKKVLPLIKSNE
ncbi:MAG: hydrolase [Candidatus Hydrogenedentes bacterium]|nr:hydrolase [Candidatus Hydrogenedentota bacterium]